MKKFKFWFLIGLYLLLAFADGALTYINTPDLTDEANPLVTVFGLGWTALFIANATVFVLLFLAAFYSYFKYETKRFGETKYSAYGSLIIYDRPDKFWTGLIPKHITPIIAAAGYATLYALIVARLVIVLEWLSITFNLTFTDPYFHIRDTYLFGRVDIILAAIITIVGIYYWIYLEYKKQLPKKEEENGKN